MTECNVKNRTIFCDDNLDVMRGINSQCVDLIYLDPPFNKNKKFTAPIGSSAEGAEFSDIFRQEDVKGEWLLTISEDHPDLYHYLNGIKGVGNSYNFAYLAYMAIRLLECHRVLKPTGSIYLHCDPTMSHYLKTVMDCIFGEKNFRNEIVWSYEKWTNTATCFQRNHDTLLFYARSDRTIFNKLYGEPSKQQMEFWERGYHGGSRNGKKIMRVYDRSKITPQQLAEWQAEGRAIYDVSPDLKGKAIAAVWQMPMLSGFSKERTGYPTQKPLKLLQRVIQASSNKGDIVLDPFCGCATTCVAAEQLGRQWIGVDVSIKAYELVKERLTKEAADPKDLFKYQNEIYMHTYAPKRTDQETDYRERKYVYIISHPAYPNEYKVGIAKNWRSRLNSYQTSDPGRQYKIEFKLETPLFRETEKHIHNVFPNKHEWVQADLKDIINEIKTYTATPASPSTKQTEGE